MPTVALQVTVTDYAKWRPIFDQYRSARAQAGFKNERVFRNVDDPNEVVIWGDATVRTRVFRAAWIAFSFAFPVLYTVLFHWLWGQTMGKMVVGARAVALDGGPLSRRRAVLRALGWALSVLTFGLGFLVAALRRDKRGLADLVAGTRVERV